MSNYQLIKNTEWKEVEINGELKEIPSDWSIFKLSSLVKRSITKGTTPTTIGFSFLDKGDVKFFKVEHLKEDKILPTNIFINNQCNEKMKRSQLEENDLLFSIAGTIGNVAKVKKDDLPANINQAIAIIRFKNINDLDYTKFYIKNYVEKITKNTLTGVIPNFNLEMLENIEIPYPNKEQSAIASILSEQESVIENIEQLIQKYESRFQYLSDELLSGRLRVKELDGEMVLYKNPDDNWKEVEINGEMKEIPSDWENSTPKKLNFSIKTGKKDANAAKENGKYPFFTCSSNEILSIDTYVFDTEAILISGNGSTLGEVRYYKGKFDAYQRTYVIDNIKNIFYMNLYFKKYFRESLNIIGGSIPFIKLGDIENFNILIPKENEISLIVSILTQQENLIDEQKQMLQQEKQKFNWFLDNLLSGKYLIKEN